MRSAAKTECQPLDGHWSFVTGHQQRPREGRDQQRDERVSAPSLVTRHSSLVTGYSTLRLLRRCFVYDQLIVDGGDAFDRANGSLDALFELG